MEAGPVCLDALDDDDLMSLGRTMYDNLWDAWAAHP